MQKSEIKWIMVMVVLLGVYWYFFHNRFAREQMIINPSVRPTRHADATMLPVLFSLNDNFRLTSVKVIPYEGEKFNPLGRPIWQLVSDSNSIPTRAFRYGQPIQGMKPALKGTHAEPLEPGVEYRLLVEAGKISAFADFIDQQKPQ